MIFYDLLKEVRIVLVEKEIDEFVDVPNHYKKFAVLKHRRLLIILIRIVNTKIKTILF